MAVDRVTPAPAWPCDARLPDGWVHVDVLSFDRTRVVAHHHVTQEDLDDAQDMHDQLMGLLAAARVALEPWQENVAAGHILR